MCEHDFILSHDRELHVRIWNRDAQDTVICWHGLARTGGDFLEIGDALASKGFRVIAPDTIGRGLSQWAESASEYEIPNYLTHVQTLLSHYEIASCTWLGTSMGGLIGMVGATTTLKGIVQKLIINDIGPEIPKEALQRIAEYVNDFPEFDQLSGFEHRIRELYAPFGERSNQQWHEMAIQCSRRLTNGRWVSHYDPNIVGQFDPSKPAVSIWELFESIDCPLMLIHGLDSDVLPMSMVNKMRELKPDMHYLPIERCGHAPGLHVPSHIDPVVEYVIS